MNDPCFNEYKQKRDIWIQCMNGEGYNSILKQIWRMIWNTAAFRVINEARKIAPSAQEGGVQLNYLIHNLIDKCFFESQASAIRRLNDTKRNVYSLVRLLDDMSKNVKLMTRENIFKYEQLEYDVEKLKQKEDEYIEENVKKGLRAWGTPKEIDPGISVDRHKQIDFLAGVDYIDRSPSDCIRRKILINIRKRLIENGEDIIKYTNRYVAHATKKESGNNRNIDEIPFSLNDLWRAHKNICEMTNFINLYILIGANYGFLAIPQFNQFKYIDKPLVASENIQVLKDVWDEYNKETFNWMNWGIPEYRKEFQS